MIRMTSDPQEMSELPEGFVAIGVHMGRLAVLEVMVARYREMVVRTTEKLVGDPYAVRMKEEANEMWEWVSGMNADIKASLAPVGEAASAIVLTD